MVDAENAFNSLNRIAALWNVRVLWPRCSRFLFNTYRGWAALVVRGSDSLSYSKEGVTQGNPLSMLMYAVSSLPLISSLNNPARLTEIWYADDTLACSTLDSIQEWFCQLKEKGPKFGYFPERSTSYLVVDPEYVPQAEEIFANLGINVECNHILLGGVIGSYSGKKAFVEDLVKKWISELECLTKIAASQPQAAFSAFTKSVQFQWTYVQRVTPDCQSLFTDLETAIWEKFLPTVMGSDVSCAERVLLSLPARWGGLGIFNPTETADRLFKMSATDVVVQAIKRKTANEMDALMYHLNATRIEFTRVK